jgi:hypothetical protein
MSLRLSKKKEKSSGAGRSNSHPWWLRLSSLCWWAVPTLLFPQVFSDHWQLTTGSFLWPTYSNA